MLGKIEPMTEESKLLIPAYARIINKIIYNTAKSTPIEERRAAAEMAVCSALRDYNPILGSLNRYVERRIREELIKQNKQYSNISRFNSKSLDAPVNEGEKHTCGDFLMPVSALSLQSPENILEMKFFLQSIKDVKISHLIKKLHDGYTVDEICDELNIKYAQFSNLCNKAAELWENYNREEAV